MLPESPPSDVFTPSLVRRPPLSQTRNQKVKYNFCVFCKNNGEDESYYLSHTLKDDNGRVTCPILYKYKCPICHSTGPVSHTIRYCPHNKDHHIYEEKAHITVLKQMRSSTGNFWTVVRTTYLQPFFKRSFLKKWIGVTKSSASQKLWTYGAPCTYLQALKGHLQALLVVHRCTRFRHLEDLSLNM